MATGKKVTNVYIGPEGMKVFYNQADADEFFKPKNLKPPRQPVKPPLGDKPLKRPTPKPNRTNRCMTSRDRRRSPTSQGQRRSAGRSQPNKKSSGPLTSRSRRIQATASRHAGDAVEGARQAARCGGRQAGDAGAGRAATDSGQARSRADHRRRRQGPHEGRRGRRRGAGKGKLYLKVGAKIGVGLLDALVPSPLDVLKLYDNLGKSLQEARAEIRKRNLDPGRDRVGGLSGDPEVGGVAKGLRTTRS